MKKILFFLVAILSISLSACEYDVIGPEPLPTIPTGDIKFTTDVYPIIQKNNCAACHNSGTKNFSSATASFNSLMNNGFINLTTPAQSIFYTHVSNPNDTHMDVSSADKAIILGWITKGAVN